MQNYAETTQINAQSNFLRYIAVTLTISLYIGIGFLSHPDANTYLLIGIPITVLFQLLIARRPLRELWLRDGKPMCFDRGTAVWLLLFLIGPVLTIIGGIRSGSWPIAIYGLIAILGAVGAALAFRVLPPAYLRQLGLLLVLTIPIGLARLFLQRAVAGTGLQELALGKRFLAEIQSLLFYVPALFIAEEVFFRGALDSYLHAGEPGSGWASAIYISVLWGLWHTPIVGPISVTVVLVLVGAQLVAGLILTWFWRQTGNMAMPATIHAIIDAVRNALLV
jgi:membrane protease YdiL (CAAX protease family)